jgi:hypothetical protein
MKTFNLHKGEHAMSIKNMLYAAGALLSLVNFSCCTAIGFMVGDIIDGERAVVSPPVSTNKIKSNTPVMVHLSGKREFAGTFLGFEKTDSVEYNRRYELFRNSSVVNRRFPAMNDTLVVSKLLGYTTVTDPCFYVFKGFDLNAICLQSLHDNRLWIKNMDSLVTITGRQGKKMNARTIHEYVSGGMVPLQSELLIHSAAGVQRIPAEEIRQIELPKPASGRMILSLAGLTADILVFRYMVRELNKELTYDMSDIEWE